MQRSVGILAFGSLCIWSACVAEREPPDVATSTAAVLALDPGLPSPIEDFTDFGALKILTYNTFQRPDTPIGTGVITYDAHDPSCRAHELGAELRRIGMAAGYYDVVLLQETLDSSALDELVDEVKHIYPHRVEARPNDFWSLNNGGLTILSKHPLQHPFSSRATEVWDELHFGDTCNGTYDSGSDCLAAKGAVWTSLSVGEVGMVDLVVTHTDALQAEGDVETRKQQFTMIKDHLTLYRRHGRPLFIVGDLNVDDTYNSLFDNQPSGGGCTFCPRPNYAQAQAAAMLDRLNGTSLWNRWALPANRDFLTYSRNLGDLNDPPGGNSANHFAGNGSFRDWDDGDYRARFDHIIYFDDSGEDSSILITMDSASDLKIQEFANSNCTDRILDVGFVPEVIQASQTMNNLSDHYGVEAKIHFWKNLAAAAAELPPATPSIPTFNFYLYNGPHYRNQDGIARVLGENMSYTGRWQVTTTLDSSRLTAGTPLAVNLEEEELIGSTWTPTAIWQSITSTFVATDDGVPGYGKNMTTNAFPGAGAIDKPMSPADRYYRYRVNTCNAHGCSPWSDYSETVRVWYKNAPLGSASFGLSSEPLCGGAINLNITPVAGATQYRVYSTQNYDAAGTKALVYRGPSVNIVDADLPRGTYKYWVQACRDDKGDGTGLPLTCTEPTKKMLRMDDYDPAGVPEDIVPYIEAKRINSHGNIVVEWPRTGDATEYHLQEARNAAFTDSVVNYTVPQPAGGPFVEHSIAKAFNSGDYYYRVKPRNLSGSPCGFTRNHEPASTTQLLVDTKSVSFDGADEYVNTNRDYATGGATKATWSVWLKPTGFPANQDVWSKAGAGGQTEWVLRLITGGRLRVVVSGTGSATVFPYWTATGGAEALVANTWQHIAVVYDGTLPAADRIKVFKNGAQIAGSVTGTLPASIFAGSTSYVRIGAAATVSPIINYYSGKLSQMAVWIGQALPQDKIQELYNISNPTPLRRQPSEQPVPELFSGGPPHHWYQMGEGDIFPGLIDGGVSGTINATMMNMEAGDIVSDAP